MPLTSVSSLATPSTSSSGAWRRERRGLSTYDLGYSTFRFNNIIASTKFSEFSRNRQNRETFRALFCTAVKIHINKTKMVDITNNNIRPKSFKEEAQNFY